MSAGSKVIFRVPRGRTGEREMFPPTSAIMGKGLGNDVALIRDGRFSGHNHGFGVCHVTSASRDAVTVADFTA